MNNSLLFEKAVKHLVGGVDSPVRSFKYAGTRPLLIKKGRGTRVYDYEGNSYIDYVLSYGALILGHAYPSVVKSLNAALKDGSSFGTTNLKEIELAELIKKAIPFIEKIRFVNSGTEAVLGAAHLARGYTGRNKVLKFRNSYHGHADYLLEVIGDYGDVSSVENIFKKYGRDIAAVILEPVGGNFGVVLPDKDFLKYLRRVTKRYCTLLIFDEIITGFRFRFGSSASLFGVDPDLVCLGKIIGGGLPIGAYGGRGDVMNNLAPLGEIYQGSTFAGNPIVMQSGIAALKEIAFLKNGYKSLENKAGKLSRVIKEEAEKHKIDLKVTRFGTIFSVRFKEKKKFQIFYAKLLKRGVYFAPSENEVNFVSFSHTKKDIDKTINAIKEVLGEIWA